MKRLVRSGSRVRLVKLLAALTASALALLGVAAITSGSASAAPTLSGSTNSSLSNALAACWGKPAEAASKSWP